MAKKTVKSPAVKRLPKVKETLDDLDKYDPDGESDQFAAMLSEVMSSTSTILTDPRMDPSDIPQAGNYYDWLSGSKFLAFHPFSRQADIGMQLHLDVCWKCSPDYYDGPDVNHKWHYSEYKSRFQLMNKGVCPKCGSTRLQGIKKKRIFDKYLHTAIAGQRCVTGDTMIYTDVGPMRIDQYPHEDKLGEQLASSEIRVLTPISYVNPTSFHRYQAKKTYRMTLANGGVLRGTDIHPVYTPDEYVQLQHLQAGDWVYATESHLTGRLTKMVPCRITKMEVVEEEVYVYDFTIPEISCFYTNTVLSHNSSKCLTGDTLISTPDGPIPIVDLINGNPHAEHPNVVRLAKRDAIAFGEPSQASYVYRIELDDGGVIEPNAQHRLFTSERGYVTVAKKDAVKVGEHLERPALKPMCKPVDETSIAFADGDTMALSALGSRGNQRAVNAIIKDMWRQNHDFKTAFFTRLAIVCGHFSLDRIGFCCTSEGLDRALLAWLEALGVRCRYENRVVVVNIRDYVRRGFAFYIPDHLRAHYRTAPIPDDTTVYPEAYSLQLSGALFGLLQDMERFNWAHNSEQKTRMTEVYATWADCKQGGRLTPERARHLLKLLREWRNIAWTPIEREFYNKALNILRHVLTTRFAKIVKTTRSKERVPVYDLCVPNHEWFVANGLHSHNSVLTGHLIGYNIHRLICTGDPAAYYGLLPGTVLTCILTATTMQNAERNLYTPMRNMFTMMPWFVNFTNWCKERENELGVELVKVRESFTFFRYGGLDIRVLSPDRRRIRGSTSFATATDELGHFDVDDGKDSKVRASGLEVYSALSTSLTNVLGAAARMRNEGENDVVFPCSHAISSPFSKTDPIMTLYNQQKDRDDTLTYIIPTWKFNPNLTYEMCKDIALPATFMRDYGCEVSDVTGSFVGQPEAIYDLCLDQSNAVKTLPETFTSRSGAKYTIAKLHIKSAASEDMVTGLALDYGWKNNSYAFTIFSIEQDESDEDEIEEDAEDQELEEADDEVYDEEGEGEEDDAEEDSDDEDLDTYRVILHAIGEVMPTNDNPIHFTQMVRHVLYPLIENFNVKVVVSDRWQTLQTQQDVMDEFGIEAFPLTPKIRDFQIFREALFAQSILLPRCEYSLQEIISMQAPSDFAGRPVAHLIRQILSVKETPKTVEKGLPFSDDLFRVAVLAHMSCRDEVIREMLVSDGEVAPSGPASLCVTVNNAQQERSAVSAITFSSGSTLVADYDDEPGQDEDDEEPVTSMVTRR
jgi:hypothetical protein